MGGHLDRGDVSQSVAPHTTKRTLSILEGFHSLICDFQQILNNNTAKLGAHPDFG